jgi:hypothetical protein
MTVFGVVKGLTPFAGRGKKERHKIIAGTYGGDYFIIYH